MKTSSKIRCKKCKKIGAKALFSAELLGRYGGEMISPRSYIICNACNAAKKRAWYKKNAKEEKRSPIRRFNTFSNSENRNGTGWSITKGQYLKLVSGNCFYCTVSLKNETGRALDRLDSSIGYCINNVVPCCGPCNIGRNINFTPDEWKAAMMAVKHFRLKENQRR